MPITQTKDAVDWIEKKTKTKSGFFSIGLLFALIPAAIVVWFMHNDAKVKAETIIRQEVKIDTLINQKARSNAECIKAMNEYLDMFKRLGGHFAGNVNTIRSVEAETSKAIREQNELIHKIQNDETDN